MFIASGLVELYYLNFKKRRRRLRGHIILTSEAFSTRIFPIFKIKRQAPDFFHFLIRGESGCIDLSIGNVYLVIYLRIEYGDPQWTMPKSQERERAGRPCPAKLDGVRKSSPSGGSLQQDTLALKGSSGSARPGPPDASKSAARRGATLVEEFTL